MLVRLTTWWRAWGIWALGSTTLVAVVAAIVVVAQGGPADPASSDVAQRHAVVVIDSAVIVFREGLEAILIFAAVTASMRGTQRQMRRPVAGGAGVAFAATFATWFGAQAVVHAFARYGDRVQAVTGLLAVAVLLLVMNWFFHRVYWTDWIGKRNAQRRRVMARQGARGLSGPLLGLVLLGFTSVYREGFEVVLFLQNLQLRAGTATVAEGVALGLLGTAAVGVLTFGLEQRLPYKRMLVVTGVLLGVVLVVMVGGSARTLQDVGWLPRTPLGIALPGWLARWFEIVPSVETLTAQALAAGAVVGSYFTAEYVRVLRPRRRGAAGAFRPEAPPGELAAQHYAEPG
jgi:high-affinity iron transporter